MEHGLTEADISLLGANATFQAGLGNNEFTWEFAPAIAVAMSDWWIEKGLADPDAPGNTLSDWAGIIASPWFSDALHGMTAAANGIHRTFGRDPMEYGIFAARKYFDKYLGGGDVFTQVDPEATGSMPPLMITPAFKHSLLEAMREVKAGSIGCPVAKHETTIDNETFEQDPRAQDLVRRGIWKAQTNKRGDRQRISQDQTVIDRNLQVVARQLVDYESQHGNPVIEYDGHFNFKSLQHSKEDHPYPPRRPYSPPAPRVYTQPVMPLPNPEAWKSLLQNLNLMKSS